uniref:lysis protein n=1 Tax=Photorhabdus sp. RM322S TaxID=3342825 RepID=UPI0036DCBCCD
MKLNSHGYTFVALVLVSLVAHHYYGKYTQQLDMTVRLQSELLAQQNEIVSQQERIKFLSELDNQYTKELAHAKSEIDALRGDVAAGRKRLRIAATCNQSEAGSSGSMGDATSVELTGEAGSTVLDIREGIINDQAKLRYLQDYVNTECRGNNGKHR